MKLKINIEVLLAVVGGGIICVVSSEKKLSASRCFVKMCSVYSLTRRQR